MAFLPVEAAKEITRKYKRYLKTAFELNDAEYQAQFIQQLDSDTQYANGPYLDVTDSFEKGKNLEELINEGILPHGFSRIQMSQTRSLYLHQEIAIRKVLSGHNIVVSTGTGSGKTETFLIPVLADIITAHERRQLHSGVRTLLVYPMNALANDQVERLRDLLRDYPEITFGAYTGQTLSSYKAALVDYKKLNDGKEPLPNELISREQMKATPPHILITNYAMLEYLMVRPDDSVFFGPSNCWEYIVLDEAHVYSGSTGIEVSMLLRRLKATISHADTRYILTSATLGDDKSNNEVALFATNLCDSEFNPTDVVRAHRVQFQSEHSISLPVSFYQDLGNEMIKDYINDDVVLSIFKKYGLTYDKESLDSCIFNTLSKDSTFATIKDFMSVPHKLTELSDILGWSVHDVELFVVVASAAIKDGVKLFDARYHMFLRATDSVFITLGENKKLFLERKRVDYDGDIEKKVFEIGTCSFCHAIYIVGRINGENILEQCNRATAEGGADLFLLEQNEIDGSSDEDVNDFTVDYEPYDLCPACGFARRADTIKKTKCKHSESSYVRIWKMKKGRGALHKCPVCEASTPYSIVRMFFTGQEAVTSVIGTALFEELPSYKISVRKEIVDDSGFEFDDESGFGAITRTLTEKNEAKQFIAFSDSRQAAAFYASYMDRTYSSILRKRVILETIKHSPDLIGKSLSCFVENLTSEFEQNNIFPPDTNVRKEAWKTVLHELVDNIGNTSLYKMGLVSIQPEVSIVFPKNSKWGLSEDEVRALCNEFLLSMLSIAAVSIGSDSRVSLTSEDVEDFSHGGVLYSYSFSDADEKKNCKSFIPTKAGLSNKRLDYILKIAKKSGLPEDRDACIKFLSAIWNIFLINPDWQILVPSKDGYQVNAQKMSFSNSGQWYICPKCHKITCNNVKNVCPTYHCDGELIPIDTEKYYAGNHYYDMYQHLEIRPLRIVEHTAQLDKKTAYEYQKKFRKKELDVLSCSTTFEMGVDVGSLETVFMRNMPPSPSNYAQRAGRAGRSINSAAFALTFCNKSNHDFTFFNNPVSMIRGKILPPSFNVENEKIAIRHVYASAFAFFWKQYSEYFSTAKAMIGDGFNTEDCGVDKFTEYLQDYPEHLKSFITRFLPDSLAKAFGVGTFDWVDGLIGTEKDNPGLLTRAVLEYNEEIKVLTDAAKEKNDNLQRSDYLVQRINTYHKEPIIAFLSRRGIFPSYGFPVDTVELRIPSTAPVSGVFGLQLSRDLSMAIAEYAPESQIVANDNLITSRYIKKAPSMMWKMYDYKTCPNCRSVDLKPSVRGQQDEDPETGTEVQLCGVCGAELPAKTDTFLIPEWGFIADCNNIRKPGLVKPERTFNNEIAYVGKSNGSLIDFSFGDAIISGIQSPKDEMVVINASNFFVCSSCGYTEIDKQCYRKMKLVSHKRSHPRGICASNKLYRNSLGYRFTTSVLQIRFENPTLSILEWSEAYSVLQGIIRGFCKFYSVDERDISGCLQYFVSETSGRAGYSMILYDRTPGGSGYVKMLKTPDDLKAVLECAYEIVSTCKCGGDIGDTSCYSCLRNYYNQKYHDDMKRSYVVDFLGKVLDKRII